MEPQHNDDTTRLLEAFQIATSEGPFAEAATRTQTLVDQLDGQHSFSNELATLRLIGSSIQGMSLEELIQIVRLITARFHLLNKVEQLQIIRINRERSKAATKASPRTESVRSAILEADIKVDQVRDPELTRLVEDRTHSDRTPHRSTTPDHP